MKKNPGVQELGPQSKPQYHAICCKKRKKENHRKSVKVFMNQIAL